MTNFYRKFFTPSKWRNELPILRNQLILRCYFPKAARVLTFQLHEFFDPYEVAYSSVVYLQMADSDNAIHTSLLIAKMRVAPIK